MSEKSFTARASAGEEHVEIDGQDELRYKITTPDSAGDAELTPERLYAAAVASCLQQTLKITAATGDFDLTDATATAQVTLEHDLREGYRLSVTAGFDLPNLDDEVRDGLIARTLEACPLTNPPSVVLEEQPQPA